MIKRLTLFEKVLIYMVSLFILTAVLIEVKYSFHLIKDWFSSLVVIEYFLLFFVFICIGVIVNELRRYYKMVNGVHRSIYEFIPTQELEFEQQLMRQHDLERSFLISRLNMERCYHMSEKEFQYFIRDLLRQLNYSDFKVSQKVKLVGKHISAYNQEDELVFIDTLRVPKQSVIAVDKIRDLHGAMYPLDVVRGIVVTTGMFDDDSYAYAQANRIELIDAQRLELWLNEVLKKVNGMNENLIEQAN